MLTIGENELNLRRTRLLFLASGEQVGSDDDAARYIDERGFVLLAPSRDLPLPSLSEADPHPAWEGYTITDAAWRWKEVLPGRQLCAYGKFLRNRGVFISWRLLPAFWTLFGPADADDEYAAGHLSPQERLVLDMVIAEGPADTRYLWHELRHLFGGNRTLFLQALASLQNRFIITVSGGQLEGWSLHQWDLLSRQAPAHLLAQPPSAAQARQLIVEQLLANAVCCPAALVASVLRQGRRAASALLTEMQAAGQVTSVRITGQNGIFWSLPQEWAEYCAS